jgi:urease accessory protein
MAGTTGGRTAHGAKVFSVLTADLATLLTLADSRLPTGGHVHSGGIEEAVTAGLVGDLATLRAFLRRRIRTHGLVTASVAAAVHAGTLSITDADRETDARTPAPAARQASRAQGRGLARLARRVWPDAGASEATGGGTVWQVLGATPHLGVAAGAVGAAGGLEPEHTALSVVYTTMTGSATAAQRLLALDPADVAALTFELSALCAQTATDAAKELADLSDPLLDVLAQRHSERERPLFVS